MAIPKLIPIARMEDYHTDLIGKCSDGTQFFIYETFVFPEQVDRINWQNYRKEYLVMYLFDHEGNFVQAKHWYFGTTAELQPSLVEKKKKEMLKSLGKYKLCDIAVKEFQTEINGTMFGLIRNEEYESVDLQPSSTISFTEPWDGEYDT